MNERERIKQNILNSIKKPENSKTAYVMSPPITRETIQKAIKEHGYIEIPYIGEDIILERPIILSSDNHIKVAKNQVIRQAEGGEFCLLRNEHITDGAFEKPSGERPDKNISVSGGIWNIRKNQRCNVDEGLKMQGALGAVIFSGVENISLSDMVIYDSPVCGEGGKTASSYGIEISNCKSFTVCNMDFRSNHRDGVHINGPASFGHIKHIRGEEMGDDMVAMNAWDWDTSAITFGTISDIVVEDVKGPGNEMRLLPGQKLYPNGTKDDCDIKNIVIEDISGVYTFKLYAQPNIANAETGKHDVSGTVGNIKNVFFNNISFVKVSPTGFCNLPVKSLFEVCADLDGLNIENVTVDNTYEQCVDMDVRLINVGPMSAVWKNGSDDPKDWGEVFDPDAICFADNIYLKNIMFKDGTVSDKNALTREVTMKINPNYPSSLPKGGTGYGKIGKVIAKD